MMVQPHTPLSYIELCLRWRQASERKSAMAWRAISHWLAAESRIDHADGLHELAESMRVLSDLAHQHYLDLMPADHDIWVAA